MILLQHSDRTAAMEFTSRKDIKASQASVFGAISEFATFERQARSHGIEIVRTNAESAGNDGLSWKLGFELGGRRRVMTAHMEAFVPPKGYIIAASMDGIDLRMVFDLIALSPGTTRMNSGLSMVPRGIKARVMVQSLKMVRGRIQSRIDGQLADFATAIEIRQGGTS